MHPILRGSSTRTFTGVSVVESQITTSESANPSSECWLIDKSWFFRNFLDRVHPGGCNWRSDRKRTTFDKNKPKNIRAISLPARSSSVAQGVLSRQIRPELRDRIIRSKRNCTKRTAVPSECAARDSRRPHSFNGALT